VFVTPEHLDQPDSAHDFALVPKQIVFHRLPITQQSAA